MRDDQTTGYERVMLRLASAHVDGYQMAESRDTRKLDEDIFVEALMVLVHLWRGGWLCPHLSTTDDGDVWFGWFESEVEHTYVGLDRDHENGGIWFWATQGPDGRNHWLPLDEEQKKLCDLLEWVDENLHRLKTPQQKVDNDD